MKRIPNKSFLVVCCLTMIFAPLSVGAQWINTPADNSTHDEREDRPDQALEWFAKQRTFGSGEIPTNALMHAVEQRNAMAKPKGKGSMSLTSNPQWKLVGPTLINDPGKIPTAHAGRINTIAVHPTNPNTLYAGAAAGGVWKSTDGAKSWKPLTDDALSLGMGALAIDPQNPNVVYAGTGEFVQSNSYGGYGIMKSTDAGTTWRNIGPINVAAFTDIIVDPKNSSEVYAAGARSGGGVFKSTNGGTTWTKLRGSLEASVPEAEVDDLALGYDGNTQVVYAAIAGHGIFLTKDGGATWKNVHADRDMRRIHIDIMPNDWKRIVTTYSNFDNELEDVEISDDGGDTWTSLRTANISGAFDVGGNGQGFYNVYIKFDPTNADRIILGGVSIWLTENGGATWEDVGGAYSTGDVHPDQHALAFAPSDPSIAYGGNDGGVCISKDAGSQWEIPRDNLAITQFYGIAVDQNVDDLTYGGTQDNGTLMGSSSANWDEVVGGDGSFVCVDEKNSDRIYMVQPGDGNYPIQIEGGSGVSIGTGISSGDHVGWLKPMVLDSKNDKLYFGTTRMYCRTNHTGSFKRISTYLASGDSTTISCIAPFGDGQGLAVGTSGGRLWYSSNNGTSWVERTKGLPGRWVTSAAFSPTDNSTFYTTLSGFGSGHVMKTTNTGTTWADISSTLPNIPANKLVVDPQNGSVLYLGTDIGVFVSTNDGTNWIPYGTGLPNVPVLDMEIHKARRLLRIGTHGRSIWEVPLSNTVAGIISPAAGATWTIGDAATIQWHGLSGSVDIDAVIDGRPFRLASGISGSEYKMSKMTLPQSQNVFIRLTSGSETINSPLFQILQAKAGISAREIADVPLYLYDVAYDPDNNVLWGTNYNTNSTRIYKIDPDNGKILDSVKLGSALFNLTGITYDAPSQHLYVHQASPTSNPVIFDSKAYEVTTTGTLVRSVFSPSNYGTGILVRDDTIFFADRQVNALHRQNKTSGTGYEDLPLSRSTTLGPRGLSYDSKTKKIMHTWTDFNGPVNADQFGKSVLFDSYLLAMDQSSGEETASYVLQLGGDQTNVRGVEYDPRGDGNSLWVTLLGAYSSSTKLVKISLADGPEGQLPEASVTSPGLRGFELKQNYPNPFNPSTTIPYELKRDANVSIVIYDELGRQVFATPAQLEHAGPRERSLMLGTLPSGNYTYELRIDGMRASSREMVLMK